VEDESQRILGAHLLGPHAEEVINILAVDDDIPFDIAFVSHKFVPSIIQRNQNAWPTLVVMRRPLF
jgi:hypothetical protein